jgi:hypothetical protein
VLEAGIVDHRWDPIINTPAALGFPLGNPRCDWCYATRTDDAASTAPPPTPGVFAVAAVTFANGGDNIGVYVLHTPCSRS